MRRELLAQCPDPTDTYIATGIANYVSGSLSGGTRFALWFGGIHGDKKLGMEQVARIVENGRYLRPFAKIILALAARREKQDTLAQRLFRELGEQYPATRSSLRNMPKSCPRLLVTDCGKKPRHSIGSIGLARKAELFQWAVV
jgi:hypothetical protein